METYLTMENILYFFLYSFIFTIALFLIKKVSKLLAFIVFISVMYYFWIADYQQKANIKKCFTETISTKKIAKECRIIF